MKSGTQELWKKGNRSKACLEKDKENEERSRRGLLANLCINYERDRAVVHERDLHHGAKLTGGHGMAERGSHLVDEGIVERLGEGGGSCSVEGRPCALARAGKKRELADDQYATANIGDRAVHLSGVVGKDAKPGDFLCQPFAIFDGIALGHAEQQEQPSADLPMDMVVDGYAGGGDSLENDAHKEAVNLGDARGLELPRGTKQTRIRPARTESIYFPWKPIIKTE